ncbi:MAG: hypothetical protein PWP14_1668 [Methanolobus sp.]|jgi:hypothetical protein|nr:hypothetical protein [Methanolobus sp.]MDN5310274.1 hypothetical protein [Methanolobus sp.]
MKIVSRIPETSKRRHEELTGDGWVALKEPQSLVTAMAASIPLMVLNVLLTVGIFSLFRPVSPADFGFGQDGFSITVSIPVVVGLFLLLIVHEMLHLLIVPGFASSDRTYHRHHLPGRIRLHRGRDPESEISAYHSTALCHHLGTSATCAGKRRPADSRCNGPDPAQLNGILGGCAVNGPHINAGTGRVTSDR